MHIDIDPSTDANEGCRRQSSRLDRCLLGIDPEDYSLIVYVYVSYRGAATVHFYSNIFMAFTLSRLVVFFFEISRYLFAAVHQAQKYKDLLVYSNV